MRREIPTASAFTAPRRSHMLVLVALCFLCGCLSAPSLQDGPWLWFALGIAAAAGVILHHVDRSILLSVMLCCFLLGVIRADASIRVPQPVAGSYEIEATVSGGITPRSDNRIAFALTNIQLDGEPVPGKAYCTLHHHELPPDLFDGAKVRFSGRVYLPDGKSGEPHFDFYIWMRQQGYAFGISIYGDISIANTRSTAPVKDISYRILNTFERAYERVMGHHARVAMALLFSSREGLTEEENKAFQTLGIAHIMSVSGLHVGILSSLVLALMQKLKLRRRLQLPATAVFLVFYCALTGFSAAANRAAVMVICFMTSRRLRRRADRLTVLAFAMLLILLLQPLQAFNAGFALSFCAMMGIILYAPMLRRLFAGKRRLPKRLRTAADGLAVSLAAQLGVLLPTAAFFNLLPLYGVFINLLIVPLVSVVLVPLYAVVLLLCPIPLLGNCVGAAASILTQALLWLVALLSKLPHAAIRVAEPPFVLCIAIGLALVILSPRFQKQWFRRIVSATLILLIGSGAAFLQHPAEIRYIQLDVGRADCALVMDGSTTLMIDTGDDGQAALDYLMKENRDIDALFITHLHMDHIGGIVQLLESPIQIHQIYLPVKAGQQQVDPAALKLLEMVREKNIPVAELAMGDELRYNKTAVRVLWPYGPDGRTGHTANEMSLVLLVDLDGYSILCTGDLEGAYEKYAAVPADVLKVAHHGSSHSTSADFLAHVSPRYALISASAGNSRMPGADTLKRLEKQGTQVLLTGQCGDITLSVQNGILCLTPYQAR